MRSTIFGFCREIVPSRIGKKVARLVRIIVRIPRLIAMAPAAAVGGQAVMDGVMMRGPHSWAVAVRRHDGTIAVQHREIVSFASRHAWARVPLVRGVVALFEALVIGMRALFVSSEYAVEGVDAKLAAEEGKGNAELDQDVQGSARDVGEHSQPDPDPDSLGTLTIVFSMVIALAFSIGLFKIVPVTLVTFLPVDRNAWAFVLIEALIKFAIFCVYLLLVGLMPDMRRVFQYHSAEHKAINAWEHGVDLDPDRVNAMSRIHVRCGTAFIVWLFLIGVLVFRIAQKTFLEDATRLEIILARPVLLPIIAGVSFEVLRFAGQHADNAALRAVLAPGLWFQRLTTRECAPDQCEVAIESLRVVLDHEDIRRAERGTNSKPSDPDAYQVLA